MNEFVYTVEKMHGFLKRYTVAQILKSHFNASVDFPIVYVIVQNIYDSS